MTNSPPRLLVYCLPFVFSLGLNVLSPVLRDVSDFFHLDGTQGLLVVGGLNNLLLFLPMGIFSLLYSFLGRHVRPRTSHLAAGLTLSYTVMFSAGNIHIFASAYVLLGMVLGVAIPTFYEIARMGMPRGKGFSRAVNINIMIGLGLAAGQYLSALIGEQGTDHWRYTYLLLAILSSLTIPIAWWHRGTLEISAEQAQARLRPRLMEKSSLLLLSQYLPGSVPWGSLSVFIFPYLEQQGSLARSEIIFLITLLGAGMVGGSFLAGLLGEKAKRLNAKAVPLLTIAFFLVDIAFVYWLLGISTSWSFPLLIPFYILGGILLAVPGSYIKGLLFETADEQSTQTIFAAENFLESVGKGIGPAIVALLIYLFADMGTALKSSTLFWLICLVPLCMLLFTKKREAA